MASSSKKIGSDAGAAPSLPARSPRLPFSWDAGTIARGLNFTLTTSLGDIDLLGEVTGGGGFDQLLPRAAEMSGR